MRSRAKAVALAVLISLLASTAQTAQTAQTAPAVPTVPSAQTAPTVPTVPSAPTAPADHAVKLAPATGSAISPESMAAAIARLRLDPNLGGQTKVRTLRWVTKLHPRPPPTSPGWIVGLFNYLGQFGGLLLWIAGAGAAATAAVWIFRLLRSVEPRAVPTQPDADDRRVFDLDIHPDSLPDDVSAAAIELLRAGRLRDALSLLYRASLSSAVHRYGVTLGAHYTEREVLRTVKGALDEDRARYFTDLVATRQKIAYAGEAMAPDAVLPLCAGFSTCFDPPPP